MDQNRTAEAALMIDPSPTFQAGGPAIAHPLDEFYARSGLPLPPLEQIEGEEVPEPCKTLLVHDTDMTSTLEAFHGRSLHLHVLGRERRGTERSEEHTSELQSPDHLVCRLLLEKKKTKVSTMSRVLYLICRHHIASTFF